MHIILYVLDALRADHLGCHGYGRETSPHIDSLAREGVVFENCFTSATWTRPVAASILTGTYPEVHQTFTRQDTFSVPLPRLPELLKMAGFKSAAFSTMGNVASDIGFNVGFDKYHDLFRDPAILARRRQIHADEAALMHASDEKIALPRADDINDLLFTWLDRNQRTNTFSFIWSIETHAPYLSPDEFQVFSTRLTPRQSEGGIDNIIRANAADRQRLMDLYDDEIHYNDHCIGKMINHLKKLNIYDNTLVIITSDHGDAFYEHGVYGHGHIPYDELIHVPLIIKFPEGKFGGQRVSELVELIDIFPTIVAANGVIPEQGVSNFVQGHDLFSILSGARTNVRNYTFSDTQSLGIHNRYLSARSLRWKYIQIKRPKLNRKTIIEAIKYIIKNKTICKIFSNPRHFLRNYLQKSNEYLFDLDSDPAELINLTKHNPEILNRLRHALKNWQKVNTNVAKEIGKIDTEYREDEQIRKHLEKLGYM